MVKQIVIKFDITSYENLSISCIFLQNWGQKERTLQPTQTPRWDLVLSSNLSHSILTTAKNISSLTQYRKTKQVFLRRSFSMDKLFERINQKWTRQSSITNKWTLITFCRLVARLHVLTTKWSSSGHPKRKSKISTSFIFALHSKSVLILLLSMFVH